MSPASERAADYMYSCTFICVLTIIVITLYSSTMGRIHSGSVHPGYTNKNSHSKFKPSSLRNHTQGDAAVAKTQIFSVSRSSFAEPHPHEVRNSWPEASRVFENQKNMHAPSAHCQEYLMYGTRLIIQNNLSLHLNYSYIFFARQQYRIKRGSIL